MSRWREQYDRVKRWHARLWESSTVDERHIDDCYAFFTSCLALKDWLKNDETLDRAVRDAVEQHVNSDPWLQRCADVANGVKHLVIDKNVRIDSKARLEIGKIVVPEVGVPTKDLESFEAAMLHANGRVHSALLIAHGCVRQWETFLRVWKLLPQPAKS